MADSETRLFEGAVRANWSAYQKVIQGLAPAWDYCVITSANERQARAYESELDWRRLRGKLPPSTRFLVVPDPDGQRIGSGGATLNALRAIFEDKSARGEVADESAWSRTRILIIHSGGDSKRVPHLAATGKAFGVLPLLDPEGQPITPFDQLFVAVAGCAGDLSAGMMVLSGDVLLVFDHRAIRANELRGVRGVAFNALEDTAAHFGVFVAAQDGSVRLFLQKPDHQALEVSGAFGSSGEVKADTGILLFDESATAACARLAGLHGGADLVRSARSLGSRIELYEDFAFALARETDHAAYVAGGGARQIRETIWNSLHQFHFDHVTVSPIRFVHIGTTEQYLDVPREAENHGYGYAVARSVYASGTTPPARSCLIETVLRDNTSAIGEDAVLIGCHLRRAIVGRRSILSGLVSPDQDISLGDECVCAVIPLADDESGNYAILLYGLKDNPKLSADEAGCTFCNTAISSWMDAAGINRTDLWDVGDQQTIWDARLFPVVTSVEDIAEFLWIPLRPPTKPERERWKTVRRLSMADALRKADCGRIISNRDAIRTAALCAQIRERLGTDEDVRPLFGAADTRALCASAANEIRAFAETAPSPFLKARAFKAASDLFNERLRSISAHAHVDSGAVSIPSGALGAWREFTAPYMHQWATDTEEAGSLATLARVHEELAFLQVAQVIESHSLRRGAQPHLAVSPGTSVVAEVPVRIDLGGGWTDTPPYSLEKGGAVTNVALLLNGKRPIRVTAYPIPEPVVVLTSTDIGYSARITRCEPIVSYNDPGDPVALHKAALVLLGIIPTGAEGPLEPYLQAFGAGIAVESACDLPKGSGLGTSSLLAIGLVAALNRICGITRQMDDLFQDVLCLEQMLTTGGGWQDQIGGAVGGFKIIETLPGVVQKPSIRTIEADSQALKEFEDRLVVYYTGAQRLAKNILRGVVGRWLSRDPEVVTALQDLHQVALDLWDGMRNGDIDRIGALMNRAWRLNNVLNPGSSSPAINDLMNDISHLCSGAKLVGAGGGGFLVALAKSSRHAAELRERLGAMRTDGRVYDHAIAREGLVVSA